MITVYLKNGTEIALPDGTYVKVFESNGTHLRDRLNISVGPNAPEYLAQFMLSEVAGYVLGNPPLQNSPIAGGQR